MCLDDDRGLQEGHSHRDIRILLGVPEDDWLGRFESSSAPWNGKASDGIPQIEILWPRVVRTEDVDL